MVNSVHHLSLCLPEILKVCSQHCISYFIIQPTECSTEYDSFVTEAPGTVLDFKVTDSTYTTLSLAWTKPKIIEKEEDEAKGYFVEIRPAENTEWDRCNTNPITMTSYTVKGMKSLAMYWVRVIAVNDGGEGIPQELDNYVLATPPPGKKTHFLRQLILTLN